jgi:Leucine-rich repeat (LRR) protein
MTLNKDKHYEIIQQNNTAQSEILSILENYSRETDTLRISTPLHGDLNLSVLDELGFNKIKHIIIGKGELTSILLPKKVETLECTENFLLTLKSLPKSLIYLNVSYNIIEDIDISNLTNLEVLNVSHNKINSIENLPKSIKEIICDFNKIQYLNLQNLDNLVKLHASNNNITLIENLPEGITDIQVENNPSITFRNSNTDAVMNTSNVDNDHENMRNYNEALNEYFRLKNKYETDFKNAKRTVYKNEPNKKIAKQAVLQVKPKCIKCKRPVGTIFSRHDSRYEAICGDATNPCSLDIQLFPGFLAPLQYIFDTVKDDFDEVKDTIIKQKLDTLFNYISEEQSVSMFKKEIELYNEYSSLYKQYLDKYNDLYNNEPRNTLLKTKLERLFKLTESNRKLLDEYNKTNNYEFLKAAVDLQKNKIIPETHNIRMLKHQIMEMLRSDESLETPGRLPVFTLFQRPVSLTNLEYTSGEQQRVIKFNI